LEATYGGKILVRLSGEQWFKKKLKEFKNHPDFIAEVLKLEITDVLCRCLREVENISLQKDIRHLIKVLD